MPKQIGIFVDVSNLYYCINKKFKGRKLNYQKYWDYIAPLGKIVVANAYGAQIKNQAAGFIYVLKKIGFKPHYYTPKSFTDHGRVTRKADYDVNIVVDILENLEKLDLIILGSADGDFVPLIQKIQEQHKKIIVFACRISQDIKKLGELYIEIPESFLEDKNDPAKAKADRKQVSSVLCSNASGAESRNS
jgi:uncharacterized LabA/DUF88 family protein